MGLLVCELGCNWLGLAIVEFNRLLFILGLVLLKFNKFDELSIGAKVNFYDLKWISNRNVLTRLVSFVVVAVVVVG